MAKHSTSTKSLSRFTQILDGSFPSGAFVHSFGLEAHIVKEKVNTSEELKVFLNNIILYQYRGLDFVFVKKISHYLRQNRLSLIIQEEEKFSSMQNFEYAKASKQLGHNYLKQVNFDIKKQIVKDYFNAIANKKTIGNELSVLMAYAYEMDIDYKLFLLLWCKKSIINIAMASLKISRIRPSDIQKILFQFDDELENYLKNISTNSNNFNPLFEEIIYQHKVLEPKLFVT